MAPIKDEGSGVLIMHVYVRKERDGENERRVNSGRRADNKLKENEK